MQDCHRAATGLHIMARAGAAPSLVHKGRKADCKSLLEIVLVSCNDKFLYVKFSKHILSRAMWTEFIGVNDG